MKIQQNNQTGRTMMEMLGVLFVIGVLSIAGLATYRYIMRKITVNKLMDIVTHYTASLEEELLLRKKIYGGIACSQSDTNSVAEKCIFEATDHLCELYLGNEYCQDKYTLPSYSYQYAGYYVAPDVVFSVVPQSNNITLNIHFPRELCVPFMEAFTAARSQLDPDGLWRNTQFYGEWSQVSSDNFQSVCAKAPLQHTHQRLRFLIATFY